VDGDFLYEANDPKVVIQEINLSATVATFDEQIVFWSQATGYVVAARRANIPGADSVVNKTIVNYFTMGGPVIGRSGSRYVVVFSVMQPETPAAGFNYSDVYLIQSGDGGVTWTAPVNLTNTPVLEERYPSISKWNEPGKANIVWVEDYQPGPHAFNGTFPAAPVSLSRQVFLKYTLPPLDVGEDHGLPGSFTLGQNYPNPFNPSTKISYTVPIGSHVTLSVFDVLGREVKSLVDGYRNAGTYEVTLSSGQLSGGVYLYALKAGSFSEVRKMMVLK
jgi:hypothetical protein